MWRMWFQKKHQITNHGYVLVAKKLARIISSKRTTTHHSLQSEVIIQLYPKKHIPFWHWLCKAILNTKVRTRKTYTIRSSDTRLKPGMVDTFSCQINWFLTPVPRGQDLQQALSGENQPACNSFGHPTSCSVGSAMSSTKIMVKPC